MDNRTPLMSLRFCHRYFGASFLKHFECLCDASTLSLFNQYGLVVRTYKESGDCTCIGIYSLGDFPQGLLISRLDELLGKEALVFNICGDSSIYYAATDLGDDKPKSLVFSNKIKSDKPVDANDSESSRTLSSEVLPGFKSDFLLRVEIFPHILKEDVMRGFNTYSVQISERKLPRFYYVENQGRIRQQSISILSSEGFKFHSEECSELINGKEYRVLHSGYVAMPLVTSEGETLSLVAEDPEDPVTGHVRRDTLIKNLPDPILGNFSVRKNNGKAHACCDMFVYV
ncbi:hypothetical protein [Bacterioplanoides sp.]|uniref:hypothetical protein n=1 Tax=Bacterioplanoides sp. TaxID=2066072 RepID=UPI003B5995C2